MLAEDNPVNQQVARLQIQQISEVHVNDTEQKLLEAFADGILDGNVPHIVESAELARKGYGSGQLWEWVSAYCELPVERHRFVFDVDFPAADDATAFTLKITRVEPV